MPASDRPLPQTWSRDELAAQRTQAINAFVTWWKAKGSAAYQTHFATALEAVDRLFQKTDNLLSFGGGALEGRDRDLREVARYLTGPPLSEDDLRIIAGVDRLWAIQHLETVAAVIASVLDTERFPWLAGTPRTPTKVERREAQRWTAGLLAAQKAATDRRGEASRRQEQAVDDVLQRPPLNFAKVRPRTIQSLRDIAPGEYCRQSMVGGTRADLTIGLRDRILAIECKVSNSEVNSYKRLNHEVGNKAGRWRGAFGDQAIPAAVLAGVFSLPNLEAAQRAGIAIFWEHDLSALVAFVQQAV